MSYCVECGVKLAAGEPKCPLCHTPVNNPNHPVCDVEASSHPQAIEEAISRLDRRYARRLSLIFLMIPIAIVLLIDFLSGSNGWSAYVVGALVMSYCFFAVPLLYRFPGPIPISWWMCWRCLDFCCSSPGWGTIIPGICGWCCR